MRELANVIMCKSASALAPEERPVCREDLGGLLRKDLKGFLQNVSPNL